MANKIEKSEKTIEIEFLKSELSRASEFLSRSEEDSKNTFVIQFRKEKQERLDALVLTDESGSENGE